MESTSIPAYATVGVAQKRRCDFICPVSPETKGTTDYQRRCAHGSYVIRDGKAYCRKHDPLKAT